MSRPQGELRQAIADAAVRLVEERGLVVEGHAVDGVTWRDLAAAAQVGFGPARDTVKNMARAGELVRVGAAKPAGSERWQALYAPAALLPDDAWPEPWAGIERLAEARPEGTTT